MGRTNGGWEADIVGRKELKCWGPPTQHHLLPSAQFEGHISLTSQYLSGRQHQPSEMETLSKEALAQGCSKGRERSNVTVQILPSIHRMHL